MNYLLSEIHLHALRADIVEGSFDFNDILFQSLYITNLASFFGFLVLLTLRLAYFGTQLNLLRPLLSDGYFVTLNMFAFMPVTDSADFLLGLLAWDEEMVEQVVLVDNEEFKGLYEAGVTSVREVGLWRCKRVLATMGSMPISLMR